MSFTARRTGTEISESRAGNRSEAASALLGEFAASSAYVLIGEPGAGKTTAFETEADSEGELCIPVRDFLTYDDRPEWHDTTLFLDGQVRAGAVDGRSPLNEVRAKLYALVAHGSGCPAAGRSGSERTTGIVSHRYPMAR